jgi:hypothetical protein
MKTLVKALLFTTLLVNCRGAASPNAFDAAEDAIGNNKFEKARELYREAADKDPDRKQRDRALLALANIEWRIFHEDAAARTTLARVAADSSEYANALSERARMESERAADFTTAQKFAHDAVAAAKKRDDRRRALITEAIVTIEPLMRARRAKECADATPLRATIANMRALIERDGPLLSLNGRLFDAALLLDDGPSMLDAWRWYYGLAPGTPTTVLLAAPEATLTRLLPTWRGAAASTAERRELGLALAASRFFPQAALVLTDPCAREPLPHDAEVDTIVAYTEALRRIHDTANEYYRRVALGKGDKGMLHGRVDEEGRALARWLGQRDYSQKALLSELQKRFGTVITLGETSGISDIHFGHAVIDEQRPVEQYGRTATLRFIALDGIVSNGYHEWAFDGRSGDGGWAADGTIYQVRPMYADGPVRLWLSVADRESRAEEDQKIAEETERDVARAAAEPIRGFRGLELRIRRQDAERLLAAYPQRDAFIGHARDEKFATSIWSHEGRHSIDHKYEKWLKSEELEYRAKLSEVALTPAPRNALYGGILADVSSPTAHGRANRRLMEGVTAWMRANAIASLDPAKPLMPQIDKLSDEQLRAAFRSLDPYARNVTATR